MVVIVERVDESVGEVVRRTERGVARIEIRVYVLVEEQVRQVASAGSQASAAIGPVRFRVEQAARIPRIVQRLPFHDADRREVAYPEQPVAGG